VILLVLLFLLVLLLLALMGLKGGLFRLTLPRGDLFGQLIDVPAVDHAVVGDGRRARRRPP